jgi:hypothetical protein
MLFDHLQRCWYEADCAAMLISESCMVEQNSTYMVEGKPLYVQACALVYCMHQHIIQNCTVGVPPVGHLHTIRNCLSPAISDLGTALSI